MQTNSKTLTVLDGNEAGITRSSLTGIAFDIVGVLANCLFYFIFKVQIENNSGGYMLLIFVNFI